MLKTFPIDFVRAVFEWKLKSNSTNTDFFNSEDISLFSFYEHLTEKEEVDRYVERYKDLVDQQNKSDKLGFGIVTVTDSPSLTNVATSFISPFEWSCSIRCTMANRDKMMQTIYKLIGELKGKKVDVAELDNGKLLPVGTLFNHNDNYLHDEDFIGNINTYDIDADVKAKINSLVNQYGLIFNSSAGHDINIYARQQGLRGYNIIKCHYNSLDGEFEEIYNEIPSHDEYTEYKLDLSFDDVKVEEPFTLNAQDYCTIVFGGTATLCNSSIRLGNDLVRLTFSKYKVKSAEDYTFANNLFVLEPLELPSNSNANIIQNQLRSNYFKTNSHTDSIALSIQYSFLCDLSNTLLKQWYNYARYGENNLTNGGLIQASSITPNIIYEVKETWSSWGVIEVHTFKAKIIDDISLENTESDVMTMSFTMQIQGDND